MATIAVRGGDRIAVVAALESTIGPTRDLLAQTADLLGRHVTIIDAPCLEAWSHWERGAVDRYATIASHLQALDGTVDVIVLAQASMAPVEGLVQLTSLVVSSPRTAVSALVGRTA